MLGGASRCSLAEGGLGMLTTTVRFAHRLVEKTSLGLLLLAWLFLSTTQASADTAWRGMMLRPNPAPSEIAELGQWGANIARLQLHIVDPQAADNITLTQYQDWINTQIVQIDALLPHFAAAGIAVVLDLHTPPGRFSTRTGLPIHRMFHTRWAESSFIDVWKVLARHYHGNSVIWGFDILNEPATGGTQYAAKWQSIAKRTASAIYSIDRTRRIIVEPPYGDPGWMKQLKKLRTRNVTYSIHMYAPFEFTHQDLYGMPPNINFPGFINGRYWDVAALRAVLKPVMDFQRINRVPIYVGEFSAVCYAPNNSAFNYLSAIIQVFEENGWNWTYHAFREWEGWSVEHEGTSPTNIWPVPWTPREQLFLNWFAHNPLFHAPPSPDDARVFNADFYLHRYSDLWAAFGDNPAAARNHWLNQGLQIEGRRGSLEFDVQFYLATYPDLRAAFGNNYSAALDHWLHTGIFEGRKGAP